MADGEWEMDREFEEVSDAEAVREGLSERDPDVVGETVVVHVRVAVAETLGDELVVAEAVLVGVREEDGLTLGELVGVGVADDVTVVVTVFEGVAEGVVLVEGVVVDE